MSGVFSLLAKAFFFFFNIFPCATSSGKTIWHRCPKRNSFFRSTLIREKYTGKKKVLITLMSSQEVLPWQADVFWLFLWDYSIGNSPLILRNVPGVTLVTASHYLGGGVISVLLDDAPTVCLKQTITMVGVHISILTRNLHLVMLRTQTFTTALPWNHDLMQETILCK